VKAFLLYLAMSLFYERTGHRDSFFEVNLMDPSLGQEYPNLFRTYSLFVFIGQYSVYIIGGLLLPYIMNDKHREEKERLGYPKTIQDKRKAKEELQNQ
jgi:hypothetical protein